MLTRRCRTSDLVTSHVKEFLQLMENAVNDDLDSLEKRQPALKKLALLPRVVSELKKYVLVHRGYCFRPC